MKILKRYNEFKQLHKQVLPPRYLTNTPLVKAPGEEAEHLPLEASLQGRAKLPNNEQGPTGDRVPAPGAQELLAARPQYTGISGFTAAEGFPWAR